MSFQVAFTDDFGETEPDKKLGLFEVKADAEKIVAERNRQLEARSLDQYGWWRVRELRARDRRRPCHAKH